MQQRRLLPAALAHLHGGRRHPRRPVGRSVCLWVGLSVCRSVRTLPPPLPRAAEPRARPRPGASPPPAAARGRGRAGHPRHAPAAPPANRGRAVPGAGQWARRPREAAAANVGVAHAANSAAERRERRPMGQRQDCGRRAPPRPAPPSGRDPRWPRDRGARTEETGQYGTGRDSGDRGARSVRTGQNTPSENHNFTAQGSRTEAPGACLRSVPERSSSGGKNNPSQREIGVF